MTKQQQKLYDKLLKKVNEYCLGAAAEDVIAAIDALVDAYEDEVTETQGYATRYAEELKEDPTSKILEEICDEFRAIDIGIFGIKMKTYQTLEEVTKDRTFLFDELYGYVNGKTIAKYNSHEEKFELFKEVRDNGIR